MTCGVTVGMVRVPGFGRGFELRRTGGVPLGGFVVIALAPGACCEERRGWLDTRRWGFGEAAWRRVVCELYRTQRVMSERQ